MKENVSGCFFSEHSVDLAYGIWVHSLCLHMYVLDLSADVSIFLHHMSLVRLRATHCWLGHQTLRRMWDVVCLMLLYSL